MAVGCSERASVTPGGATHVLNRRSAVPRHNEISDVLANKICKDLGIPPVIMIEAPMEQA